MGSRPECHQHGAGLVLALAIKFHYHRAPKDVPRLGIFRGDRLCHVYSDKSVDELVAWGEVLGWKPYYLDLRNDLPHFDAFRTRLRHCGEGVSRQEFVRDVREWRTRKRAVRVGSRG